LIATAFAGVVVVPIASCNRPIRVFVHLAHGFGASQWQAKWNRSEIIGINDRLPYGYFWAQEDGCIIEYSEDKEERRLERLVRLGSRVLLGFDFVHAWRNRRGITRAQIVWTHTESQYLAVLLLLRIRPPARRPKLIAQSIWLFDRWDRLWRPQRWFYAWLIRQADVLTVHSPENLPRARQLFPMCRSEMIPFGIRAEEVRRRSRRAAHYPIRVLSLGNDRDRDWQTLVNAVKSWEGYVLRLVSPHVDSALTRGASNVEIVRPRTNEQLMALYDWADVIALAIKPNLHASGITVLEEATICGVPVICTDTGGLRAYFSDREVKYVPPHQPDALRHEIAALAKDGDAGPSMVEQARARMISAGLSSRRFAQRHAALSRELLGVPETSRASPPMHERDSIVPFAERSLRSGLSALKGAAMLCAAAGIVAVAVLAGGGPLSSQVRAAGDRIDLCAFRPTFTEDFNTLSVSPWGENGSRWIAHTPWHGDFGDAAFADPQADFPFRVGKGILEIEARKNPDGNWQSGLLASATPSTAGFAQQFGYFETRAQLPPGPGVWPAFWLDSNQPQGSQKPGVEIDVLEYYGQFTNAYHSSVHIWEKIDPTKSRVEDHITEVPAGSLSSAFHTHGADVEPDWITFYLDRREIWRVATPPELQDPLMVLVNLALGSGWPIDQTPNPSVMLIDYVHVYRHLAKAEKPACATSGGGTDSLEIIRR
jgi:glycosyltransferase involved in cell wall biosynthesis